jgi:hypothetical protein
MNNAARELIASFEALPEQDQHLVPGKLLRRLIESPYSTLADEQLTEAADLVFQDYDRPEGQGLKVPQRGEVWAG